MRLFGYYALHTFVNQLRKLFKTWVVVFILVCGLLGGLIGYGAATLEDMAAPEAAAEEEEDWELPISGSELTELVAGGVLLALFAYEAISADTGGSKIFLPADVNLLFASPMKPQSVLMFRLAAQAGQAILLTLYLLFQLPNLVLSGALTRPAALALLAAWFAAVLLGRLLKVLLYMVGATYPGAKDWIRRGLYAGLLILGGAFLAYARGGDWLVSAARFFNSPVSRWVPFWGWLKAVPIYANQGRYWQALCNLLLTALGGGLMVFLIWHMKADFYEDAMAKSEETAALMEKARAEKSSGVAATRQRKKERADTLRRDGLNRGSGASVFFYKTMYNRFRFAHFRFFTKTMETYLVLAVGGAALLRFVSGSASPLPIALGLGVMVFFRAMGNPLEEDTAMDFFRLIPEPAWKKMLYSALGGLCNTMLDLLVPMLAAAPVLGCNPLSLLVWLPVIVTVDFYASSVGAFIDLSVPASIGRTLKTLIQVMFIYFGLLPDIAILAVAIVLEHTVLGAAAVTAVNLFLGILFFCLASVYLEPRGREVHAAAQLDTKAARRDFSRIGWSIFILGTVSTALQLLLPLIGGSWLDSPWALWFLTFAPQYLAAFPLAWLILRRIPAQAPARQPFGAKRTVIAVFVCLFLMYGGNLLGSLITAGIGFLRNAPVVNPTESYAFGQDVWMTLLFVVILAPILEETLFRKLLIDRMAVYGGKIAVVVSALLFGLYHGNLSQFFYAFGLGLAFGYIYLNTGRLRNTVFAHMCINFLGMVFAPWLVNHLPETEAITPWVVAFGLYTLFLIAGSLVGLVLLLMHRSNLRFPAAEKELGRRYSIAAANPGMLLALLYCLAMIALSLTVS